MRTLVPGYPQVMAGLETSEPAYAYSDLFGGPARVLAAQGKGLDLFVIDAPHLFDRPGNPYLGPNGLDWADNAQRFAALARVGADIGKGSIAAFVPDVVHAHDWQARWRPPISITTAARGPARCSRSTISRSRDISPPRCSSVLGLPAHAMTIDGVEYFGGVGFLKAGLQLADRITTVSPTYAREIMTPEFGMALEGLLWPARPSSRGSSTASTTWSGTRPPTRPWRRTTARFASTCACAIEAVLQQRLGLTPSFDAPLFGVVSRLTSQKGLDLLLGALPYLVAEGAQIAVLGTGEATIERLRRGAAGL